MDKANAAGKLFGTHIAKDRWGRPVLLFRNEWKVVQLRDEDNGLGLVPCSLAPDIP